MILADLLQHIICLENSGNTGIEVTGIQFDSRKATQGTVFVATRGTATDGHDFIGMAIENGASAVICEAMPEMQPENVTFIRVANSSDALGQMARG